MLGYLVSIRFSILEASKKIIFLWGGLSAPHPTCNLENPGIPFYLGDHL
jgi:hypothetical protein